MWRKPSRTVLVYMSARIIEVSRQRRVRPALRRNEDQDIMKKNISVKTVSFFAAVFLFCGSVYVAATEYGKMSAAYHEGLKMKEIFSDASKSQIVAEINGVPVSAFQVEFKRYINDYLTDDMAILNEIGRERFLLENAKAAGLLSRCNGRIRGLPALKIDSLHRREMRNHNEEKK